MRARLFGLVAVATLAVPALVERSTFVSATTAQFYVTGYTLQGYTATGTYVHPGTCAVDPRVIPLGTTISIAGLGTCHAEDTGGAIVGYRIDVWEPSTSQAYAITGWRAATWGDQPQEQVLAFRATNPHLATATATTVATLPPTATIQPQSTSVPPSPTTVTLPPIVHPLHFSPPADGRFVGIPVRPGVPSVPLLARRLQKVMARAQRADIGILRSTAAYRVVRQ